MHELSIAYSLVELATESARKAGARRVSEVHLRLGVLAGVVREALEFSYDVATADTMLDHSKLLVEVLPIKIYCRVCATEVELEGVQRFRCPRCDTPSGDIRQGRELEITSIEIEMPE